MFFKMNLTKRNVDTLLVKFSIVALLATTQTSALAAGYNQFDNYKLRSKLNNNKQNEIIYNPQFINMPKYLKEVGTPYKDDKLQLFKDIQGKRNTLLNEDNLPMYISNTDLKSSYFLDSDSQVSFTGAKIWNEYIRADGFKQKKLESKLTNYILDNVKGNDGFKILEGRKVISTRKYNWC